MCQQLSARPMRRASRFAGGDLAALPLLRRFDVSAARLSAYFYNTTNELDRLADVLSSIPQRSQVGRVALMPVTSSGG
jgi:selenocysteine lyase/cysteine desulfurase